MERGLVTAGFVAQVHPKSCAAIFRDTNVLSYTDLLNIFQVNIIIRPASIELSVSHQESLSSESIFSFVLSMLPQWPRRGSWINSEFLLLIQRSDLQQLTEMPESTSSASASLLEGFRARTKGARAVSSGQELPLWEPHGVFQPFTALGTCTKATSNGEDPEKQRFFCL